MKATEQATILAKAVFLSLAEKNKEQTKKVVDNFITYLQEHKLMSLLPKVMIALRALQNQATDTVGVTVISSQELTDNLLKKLSSIMKDRLDKDVILDNQLDKEIIGGLLLRYDDKMIDVSIKNKVNQLVKQLAN
ncbi:ATP synthase F1 subunit delta [bacterium]|mgnify:CR=1 FL=1|jgi:F-type H+-transporting ATPase subunit delta|nr:ATP synthase F1 subunit delta [bacterium]